MKNWRVVIAALILAMPISYAMSDYTATQGSGITVFDFICFATKHCPASTLVTSAGTEISVATSTLQTTGNSSLSTIATNTTGAATAANQTTGNSSLSTIATNTTGVATAANQTTGNSSLSTIATNTTGAATAANQTTGNSSLASILAAIQASIPAGTNTIGTVGQLPYPVGATAIVASTTGTTGATTATLAGTSSKTTYICSYSVRANATGAATVNNTIAPIASGLTMTHVMWVAPLASGIGIDEQIFMPCLPASATNTSILVIGGAPGSGGAITVTAAGYQL